MENQMREQFANEAESTEGSIWESEILAGEERPLRQLARPV